MVMKNLFKLNKISLRAQKYIFILFIIVLSVGLLEALILSPEDYKQSESVRIMYVHVPSAWTSVGIFSLIAFLSLGQMVFKNKYFSTIAKSLAPSGLIFNIIALVTGCDLGKTYLGNLVGMGCKNYIDVNSLYILHIIYFKLESA